MREPRPRFPFARPDLPRPEAWLDLLETSYRERWFSNGGPLVRRLEGELAARDADAGREAPVVASATAGLVATLLALGLRGPVAVPAFTFPASAHAIELAGCTPVLCDVDPNTWELAPHAVERAVREHGCVAVMHVRAFGMCRDLGEIERVAAAAGVPLIVDSAAAYGGRDDAGVPAGRAGDAEVFSFHATKVFAAGEGGAVLAPPSLAAAVRHTGNFALEATEVTGRGLNAKLSELTAAVALAMLDKLDEHVACRRELVERLLEAVRASGVPFAAPLAPGRPPWQGLPLLLDDPSLRERALAQLLAAGVGARAYYAPGLHRTRAFARFAPGPLPVTDDLSERILCLPVYSHLHPAELEEFLDAVHSSLNRAVQESGVGLSRS